MTQRPPETREGFFMKILLLLLFVAGFVPNRADSEDFVELTMQTRGTEKRLRVSAAQTEVQINDDTRRVKTSPAQWQRLVQHLNALRLAELPRMKSNASRSAVDAAYQAQIRVVRAGKTYETNQFDYPNAPKPLAGLLKTLVETIPEPERAEF